LRAALTELRELARGIHPAILTQAGLEPAIRSLVDRAAITATLDFAVTRPLPERVEAAAYFVVSEALTNVAKHAAANSARVAVREENGTLVVEIRDDGCGGADAARGSGLRGLRDRVEAIGGILETASSTGSGTTIRATLPAVADDMVGTAE
jgi:signal transduction histidine kinase